MPTFTSIALDRLIEPGATRPMPSHPKTAPRPRGDTIPRPIGETVPRPRGETSKLNRRNSVTVLPTVEKPVSEKKYRWAQITPALYTTPETTPLPDSPSSFPPSPYIINHKRRGPRLIKSHSVASVSSSEMIGEVRVNGCVMDGIDKVSKLQNDDSVSVSKAPIEKEVGNGFLDGVVAGWKASDSMVPGHENGVHDGKVVGKKSTNGVITINGNGSHAENTTASEDPNWVGAENDLYKSPLLSPGRDESEGFVDPQESLSFCCNGEADVDCSAENSVKLPTPGAEFFDAWEELSSEGGGLPPNRDYEAELREMRLGLLLEVEKRKQAEEALSNMQNVWQRIREELSQVGIVLPPAYRLDMEEEHSDSDPVEDLGKQVYVARFVSQSIGRGIAKAEAQAELEAQLEVKNFEIARLCDRLNYYEAVNREMSQRNQEAVEAARRLRQERKRKHKWVWGASIAAAVTLGTAALAWSYIPAGSRGSSSSSSSTSHSQTHVNSNARH